MIFWSMLCGALDGFIEGQWISYRTRQGITKDLAHWPLIIARFLGILAIVALTTELYNLWLVVIALCSSGLLWASTHLATINASRRIAYPRMPWNAMKDEGVDAAWVFTFGHWAYPVAIVMYFGCGLILKLKFL